MLVHVWLHPPLLIWHSSTSVIITITSYYLSEYFFNLPLQSRLSAASEYPISQEHSNEPNMLVHVWLHPPLLVWHSSTSVIIIITITSYPSEYFFYLPLQSRLSAASEYPMSQEHSNEPWVLVHVWLHPPLWSSWHSSTSEMVQWFIHVSKKINGYWLYS